MSLAVPGLFSACSTVSTEQPPVADSTFTRLLVELHLLTAREQRKGSLPPGARDSLFSAYGIEREDFESTLRYHAHRPGHLVSFYNSVLDTLRALERRSYQVQPPNYR